MIKKLIRTLYKGAVEPIHVEALRIKNQYLITNDRDWEKEN